MRQDEEVGGRSGHALLGLGDRWFVRRTAAGWRSNYFFSAPLGYFRSLAVASTVPWIIFLRQMFHFFPCLGPLGITLLLHYLRPITSGSTRVPCTTITLGQLLLPSS